MNNKEKSTLIAIAFLAFGIYWFTNKKSINKRQALIDLANNSQDSEQSKANFSQIVNSMTDSEINDVYTFIFDFVKKGKSIPKNSALYQNIAIISSKYNIFT